MAHWFTLRTVCWSVGHNNVGSSLVSPWPLWTFKLYVQVNQCKWMPAFHPKFEVLREIDFLKNKAFGAARLPPFFFRDGFNVLTSELTKFLGPICKRTGVNR